jgi:predicted permease
MDVHEVRPQSLPILASEYKQDAALASRMVFWTTLLSAFTLTALLALVRG